MDPLKWHPVGAYEYTAWSTVSGAFTAFEFRIVRDCGGWKISRRNLRNGRDIDVVTYLQHRAFTVADAQAVAEQLRTQLPACTGDPLLTVEEIRAVSDSQAAARAAARPTRCTVVHAFPAGATDRTTCLCGQVTKGYARRRAS